MSDEHDSRGVGEALAERGLVDRDLAEELPGLYLRHTTIDRGSGRSPKGLRERLRILSDRFAGAQAIALRNKPIPWAYRVFYRHIGLDPDEQPTPVEALALERMMKGGFVSQNLLDDALTIAIIESGVPVRAFDADRVRPPILIRPSSAGEELEGRPGDLPAGTLVIADSARPVALLFGAIGSGRGVDSKTERTLLVAIGVSGVPEIAVEEALWLVGDAMLTA
jgi:DNA/RNA-binding domain of Phe-tRNA-synthetase-like protein